jgi:hypothetical protein
MRLAERTIEINLLPEKVMLTFTDEIILRDWYYNTVKEGCKKTGDNNAALQKTVLFF